MDEDFTKFLKGKKEQKTATLEDTLNKGVKVNKPKGTVVMTTNRKLLKTIQDENILVRKFLLNLRIALNEYYMDEDGDLKDMTDQDIQNTFIKRVQEINDSTSVQEEHWDKLSVDVKIRKILYYIKNNSKKLFGIDDIINFLSILPIKLLKNYLDDLKNIAPENLTSIRNHLNVWKENNSEAISNLSDVNMLHNDTEYIKYYNIAKDMALRYEEKFGKQKALDLGLNVKLEDKKKKQDADSYSMLLFRIITYNNFDLVEDLIKGVKSGFKDKQKLIQSKSQFRKWNKKREKEEPNKPDLDEDGLQNIFEEKKEEKNLKSTAGRATKLKIPIELTNDQAGEIIIDMKPKFYNLFFFKEDSKILKFHKMYKKLHLKICGDLIIKAESLGIKNPGNLSLEKIIRRIKSLSLTNGTTGLTEYLERKTKVDNKKQNLSEFHLPINYVKKYEDQKKNIEERIKSGENSENLRADLAELEKIIDMENDIIQKSKETVLKSFLEFIEKHDIPIDDTKRDDFEYLRSIVFERIRSQDSDKPNKTNFVDLEEIAIMNIMDMRYSIFSSRIVDQTDAEQMKEYKKLLFNYISRNFNYPVAVNIEDLESLSYKQLEKIITENITSIIRLTSAVEDNKAKNKLIKDSHVLKKDCLYDLMNNLYERKLTKVADNLYYSFKVKNIYIEPINVNAINTIDKYGKIWQEEINLYLIKHTFCEFYILNKLKIQNDEQVKIIDDGVEFIYRIVYECDVKILTNIDLPPPNESLMKEEPLFHASFKKHIMRKMEEMGEMKFRDKEMITLGIPQDELCFKEQESYISKTKLSLDRQIANIFTQKVSDSSRKYIKTVLLDIINKFGKKRKIIRNIWINLYCMTVSITKTISENLQ